ncbi:MULTISPECIES: hypothetical protein [Carboxydothermus]|uniref:Uncharacterized protein n=2 Tax=Carboxydothermus TaxID=129957 RepID=A0A1L8D0R7_9THEO|nr:MULTISPECIES: hypothetical protein [Carboxydothermus]GAV21576.1 hypothetical protein cpu_00860 [Carboxydothermus pertinax]GAV24770.1 hypothetical protein ciss_07030 [Carboxydothermus islandicus]
MERPKEKVIRFKVTGIKVGNKLVAVEDPEVDKLLDSDEVREAITDKLAEIFAPIVYRELVEKKSAG